MQTSPWHEDIISIQCDRKPFHLIPLAEIQLAVYVWQHTKQALWVKVGLALVCWTVTRNESRDRARLAGAKGQRDLSFQFRYPPSLCLRWKEWGVFNKDLYALLVLLSDKFMNMSWLTFNLKKLQKSSQGFTWNENLIPHGKCLAHCETQAVCHFFNILVLSLWPWVLWLIWELSVKII